jgi:Ran GTPase-activating protein (RanGAP) involved in mRNA processing and transport
MLTAYQDLNSLHLVDTGLDCDTLLEICKGVAKSKSMEFLDLRHNIFDDKGLAGLINAFEANMVIKHIYLEGMTINHDEAERLAKFFDRKDCMLEELELNEADLDIESLDLIMESLCKADHLKKLTLAKNTLDVNICERLSKFPERLHNFEMLSLSHCNFGDEALKALCAGFTG